MPLGWRLCGVLHCALLFGHFLEVYEWPSVNLTCSVTNFWVKLGGKLPTAIRRSAHAHQSYSFGRPRFPLATAFNYTKHTGSRPAYVTPSLTPVGMGLGTGLHHRIPNKWRTVAWTTSNTELETWPRAEDPDPMGLRTGLPAVFTMKSVTVI